MIHTGTDQRFAQQTAATEALRGRVGDIDQYNIKGTTNVNFDTGKAVLSEQAKADLCRSEEHTSELQSLMRISYAVFCLKKKKNNIKHLLTLIHNSLHIRSNDHNNKTYLHTYTDIT